MNDILNLPPLEHIRSFVVFADSENIVKAAEKLKISQPLLSKHLQLLEEEIGESLFEFVGRKKELTTFGKELHHLLRAQLKDLSAEIRSSGLRRGQPCPLRIGGRKEILDVFVRRLRGEGSFTFIPLQGAEVEDRLQSKEIEIGISQKEIVSDRLVRKKLWRDEFVLCWNPGLKTGPIPVLDELVAKLSAFRFVGYSENIDPKSLLGRDLPSRTPITYFPDWNVIAGLLTTDPVWTVLPDSYTRERAHLPHMRLPPSLRMESQFYVYYQKELSDLNWFRKIIAQMRD